jgi:phospholipid/cholesterol/gamma-HCH transport system substrate-binding protein
VGVVKGLSSAIKVGVVVLIVAILSYGTFKSVSEHASGTDGYSLWGRFHDAAGLVDKSRVVIAGLTIGEIIDRRLDGKFARVTVRVRGDTQIWSNAAIFKKSSSLLGEFYLEIDPGTPQSVSARGEVVPNTLLKDGDEIATVVEATSISDLVGQVSKIVPHVDEVLLEVRDLAADARRVVNGPVQRIADNLDQTVAEDKEILKSILQRTDRIAANLDAIAADGRPEVKEILKNVREASKEVRTLLASTQNEVELTGKDLRTKLDRLDKSIDALQETMENAADVSKKVNSPDQGTLGKLVNDPTIADNVEQVTEDVRGFTQSLFGLQTIVGLRVDYNLAEQLSRAYFSVEIYTRPDKFYLVELSSDPRGDVNTTLYVDQHQQLVRSQVIASPGVKFTLQFGKKFDWLALRMGFKDSTGGFGADVDPWQDGRLKLSLDAFQFTFNEFPRVRLTLAYRFFKYLYVMGGVDDILNKGVEIPVAGNDVTGQLPKSYYIGRDPFIGMMVRFSDEDLRSLLLIGGSALAGLASK